MDSAPVTAYLLPTWAATLEDLSAWQQRVVQEHWENADRLDRLEAYMANYPMFARLPGDERDRMARQRHHMRGLNAVLAESIRAFPQPPAAGTHL